MNLQYQVKQQIERFESYRLNIHCLENLDKTIDEIFTQLERNGTPEKLEELCPYFGVIWPSARALTQVIAALPYSQIRRKRVIEIGCGLALPSLMAAHRGAQVVATDFHPDVPFFLEKNVNENHINHLTYRRVSWEKEKIEFGKLDWIFGSDILYEKEHPQKVAHTISELAQSGGKIVLTDPGRPYLQSFVDLMKDRGFECDTQIMRVYDHPRDKDIFVLTLEKN